MSFQIYKYNTDDVQHIRTAFDPVSARSSSHKACNRCHEKKLKCSGEENGCERCITLDLQCDYSRSSSRDPRKKHHRRSGEGSSHDEQKASSSSSSSKPSSKRSHGKHSSSASTSSRPAPSTSGTQRRTVLDELDVSLFQPEDGFHFPAVTEPAYSNSSASYAQGSLMAPTTSGYPATQYSAWASQYSTQDASEYPMSTAEDEEGGYDGYQYQTYPYQWPGSGSG